MFLSLPIAYSQEVTGWERKVYYEVVEKSYYLPKGSSKEAYNNVMREVAAKHGLTYGEINDIADRVWGQDMTKYEYQIIEALDKKLEALPENASQDQIDKAYKEVANQYNISVAILYDIDGRGWGWWFW